MICFVVKGLTDDLTITPCHWTNKQSDRRVSCITVTTRGVATAWTGVDMSTQLLLEVVPEIDANPVSFYWGGEGVGRSGLELDSPVASVR